jgi:signal transduction histidine kinase
MDAALRHGIIFRRKFCAMKKPPSNANGLRVKGSARILRTAVFNVLDNAVKYSGETVDVRVRLETPDDKHIVLRVQDRGVGISPMT